MKQLNKLNKPNKLKAERSEVPLCGKLKELISSFLFYLSILIFIIGFQFSDNRAGGWYQQFMPNINNRPISDITFLDSLTGFAVTPYTANDTAYILKTTNKGDNWVILFRQPSNIVGGFKRVIFLNPNTGYVAGNFMLKTTDGGLNWSNVSLPAGHPSSDLSVLNENTIWTVDEETTYGGIFYTSNGGINWSNQLSAGASNPDRIYMYNAVMGFANRNGGSFMYHTTNGGLNWAQVPGVDGFRDMYFADNLTGWKAFGSMKKTTDGGLNWVTQTLPSGGNIQIVSMYEFANINRDTIWGVGGEILQGSLKGIVYRTINGGVNWLFQVPDISPNIPQYIYTDFINKNNGWVYTDFNRGAHTTTGGDDTFYTSIKQISLNVPDKFYLGQNYPNPFNPATKIKYQIVKNSYVKLLVFDITGKEIEALVNKEQIAGFYEAEFSGGNLSSGVYFYSLYIDEKLIDTKRMVLVK